MRNSCHAFKFNTTQSAVCKINSENCTHAEEVTQRNLTDIEMLISVLSILGFH